MNYVHIHLLEYKRFFSSATYFTLVGVLFCGMEEGDDASQITAYIYFGYSGG